jgi:hypothetical protein
MRAEMGMLMILLRFPVMKSRNLSSIYCSKVIRYTTIQSALAAYHKDALVSLLFLKKIQSIEFWERQQDSGTLVQRWNVSASKTQIHGSRAERLKIESSGQSLDARGFISGRQPTIREWIVSSSTLDEHHIQNSSARETNRRHKVEARCGIAAQISPKPINQRGRLFMDVPTSQYLGLPVIERSFQLQDTMEPIGTSGCLNLKLPPFMPFFWKFSRISQNVTHTTTGPNDQHRAKLTKI